MSSGALCIMYDYYDVRCISKIEVQLPFAKSQAVEFFIYKKHSLSKVPMRHKKLGVVDQVCWWGIPVYKETLATITFGKNRPKRPIFLISKF